MIARVWRGVVAADRRQDYVTYVAATGVADYRRAAGCRLSVILSSPLDVETRAGDSGTGDSGTGERGTAAEQPTALAEVIALSIWDTEAAIRAFTRTDLDVMVLYPEDHDFLLEPPTLVHHQVDSLSIPEAVHSDQP